MGPELTWGHLAPAPAGPPGAKPTWHPPGIHPAWLSDPTGHLGPPGADPTWCKIHPPGESDLSLPPGDKPPGPPGKLAVYITPLDGVERFKVPFRNLGGKIP